MGLYAEPVYRPCQRPVPRLNWPEPDLDAFYSSVQTEEMKLCRRCSILLEIMDGNNL